MMMMAKTRRRTSSRDVTARTPADIAGARAAATCVVKIHEAIVSYLQAGQTLAKIDGYIGGVIRDLDCRSAFFRYAIPGHPPFPSQSCLSLNDCIVHGTHDMSQTPLVSGDILSIDIGVIHKGWFGDAAWTYAIEGASDEALELMICGRESLRAGVEVMAPGRPLMDFAKAVTEVAEIEGDYSLVRGLGGHGYGRTLHGPPFVSNAVPRNAYEWPDAWQLFQEGMLLAVEPMLTMKSAETSTSPRQWPVRTRDGSLSVHYEADVLITADGHENLTAGMWNLPDVVAT
jgi:methionyl aminopeptidase